MKIAYNPKTTRRTQLKFAQNVADYNWFKQTEFEGTRSRDQNVTGRKWEESGQSYTDISR